MNHLERAFSDERARGVDWLRQRIAEVPTNREPLPASATPVERAAEVAYMARLTRGFGDDESTMAARTALALADAGLLADPELRRAFLHLAEIVRDHLSEAEQRADYIAFGPEPSDRVQDLINRVNEGH